MAPQPRLQKQHPPDVLSIAVREAGVMGVQLMPPETRQTITALSYRGF